MSEKCQRCGEVGEDRRTLWMACLYEMRELNIPLTEVRIDGTLHEKSGEKELEAFGIRTAVFDEKPIADGKWKFHTMRVCKRCRGDWMLAIKDWFNNPPPPVDDGDDDGSRIYIRELGHTKQITEEQREKT